MPPRALGRLHDLAERVCGLQGRLDPSLEKKSVLVFAGDHGVVSEGVSAFPQVVTLEMIRCFLTGKAGINAICRQVGADVQVVDVGVVPDLKAEVAEGLDRLTISKVGRGTGNLAREAAMTRSQAEEAVLCGFQAATRAIEQGTKLLGTGDMGIGNTTPSSAVGWLLTGSSLDAMIGRGTGVDEVGVQRKRQAILAGVETNAPDPEDGLDVLAKVGGFEIGGIAGCILAAAYHRVPVVVDGFISTAGALVARSLCPDVLDAVFAGHCSEEPGHLHMLRSLGLEPILNLGMRLGEGTGAALAMNLMEAAVRVFTEVGTFSQAGVSEKLG
jgi:nicotinate-nucleotide--dimethylbenzimidazole phosphoribosyltransferase